MSKFKVGDRVKVVDANHSCLEEGSLHTVSYSDSGRIGLDGARKAEWYECRFERVCPNPPHKHAKLIKEWADGAEIEGFCEDDNTWRPVYTPIWDVDIEYRIKPTSNCNAGKIAEIETTISQLQQQLKELKDVCG